MNNVFESKYECFVSKTDSVGLYELRNFVQGNASEVAFL